MAARIRRCQGTDSPHRPSGAGAAATREGPESANIWEHTVDADRKHLNGDCRWERNRSRRWPDPETPRNRRAPEDVPLAEVALWQRREWQCFLCLRLFQNNGLRQGRVKPGLVSEADLRQLVGLPRYDPYVRPPRSAVPPRRGTGIPAAGDRGAGSTEHQIGRPATPCPRAWGQSGGKTNVSRGPFES